MSPNPTLDNHGATTIQWSLVSLSEAKGYEVVVSNSPVAKSTPSKGTLSWYV